LYGGYNGYGWLQLVTMVTIWEVDIFELSLDIFDFL
jgi:hypothetical protein